MSETDLLRERIAETGARALDLRFTDLTGAWRHLTVDAATTAPDQPDRHCLFDGSGLPGWRNLYESDLLLLADPGRAWADPFTAQPTLLSIADIVDPATQEGYQGCPRSALKRTIDRVRESGIADTFLFTADLGFYVFERLEVVREPGRLGLAATPVAAGAAAAHREPYLAGQPHDALADLRGEMAGVLASLGLAGLTHVLLRDRGQCELRFGPADALLLADQLQLARYVIENVARAYGKAACFLPVPAPGVAGSGLHLHLALQREGHWVFAGQGYADLSETCLHAIGGILRHTPTLNAFTNPSTNSYRRLRQGHQEPSILGFGARNRSTAIRIPAAARPEDKRIELRFPDPLANPYLALASILLAVRDGIDHAIDPGEPADRNVYDLAADSVTGLERCAPDLPRALQALEGARDGLFAGDAVPEALIDTYLQLKRDELDLIDGEPHPLEHVIYGT